MQRSGPHLQGNGDCDTSFAIIHIGSSPQNWDLRQSHDPSMVQILAPEPFSYSMSSNSTHSTRGKKDKRRLAHILTEGSVEHTALSVSRLGLWGRAIASLVHMEECPSSTYAVEKCREQQKMSGFAHLCQ